MEFREQAIPGLFEVRPQIRRDPRGSFVKTLHKDLYEQAGLNWCFAEEYYSTSVQGVLRGLHFQVPPHDHVKLVYCVEGVVFDAVVDLRKGSPTFGQHALFELSAENATVLYIPRGLAHGFCVTGPRAVLVYKTETIYTPTHDTGIFWGSVGIPWPVSNPLLSDRDQMFPALNEFCSPFSYNE